MKKKIIILLSVVIILLMGIVVWFNIPLDLMDLDPNEVMEIVVFNGNSGNATHITDKEQIQHIVCLLYTSRQIFVRRRRLRMIGRSMEAFPARWLHIFLTLRI